MIGSTTPNVHFTGDPDDADDKGVCIYLDGMSSALHGDSATAARDREIRGWLRNNGFHVIEIIYVELDDRNAMIRHFKKLARFLEGKDLAKRIAEDSSWFDGTKLAPLVAARTLPFRRVDFPLLSRFILGEVDKPVPCPPGVMGVC